MERQLVQLIQTRAEAAIRAAFAADPALKHLTVTGRGGKYTLNQTTLKFEFLDQAYAPAYTISQEQLQAGQAAPGMTVVFGVHRETYRIVKARRTKYEAIKDSDGKRYLLRFGGCALP